LLQLLYSLYLQEPSFDAYVFTNDDEAEPLCGIYRAKGLANILERLASGRLTKHSMKFMLDHIDSRTIPAKEEQKKFFRNFNAHAELNGL